MDDATTGDDAAPASELGAAEALSGGDDSQDNSVTCPNCGRVVEAGFRFCDGCGTRLDVDVAPPVVEEAAPETSAPPVPSGAPPRIEAERPAPEESVPFLERWRRRRGERSALGKAKRALGESPPHLETIPMIDGPGTVERPTGATSRPKTAEELRGARPAIGGRLQWSAAEDEASEGATAQAVWRPLAIPEETVAVQIDGGWGRFALQFVAALLAGGIALLALTALASVASDGRVALLEVRGLPILIGGAVSIIVFALLRTSERDRVQTTRRGTIVGVVVGLIGLVVLSAILYQPAVAGKLQPRIERALQVFGNEDATALEAFEQRIVEWNESAESYHDELEVALRNRENVDRLRGSAVEAETTLDGITSEMRASAEQAQHPELRDALGDLTSIYVDQLGGLRLVNRGLLVDNIDLVRTGDARFKEAHERAGALYQARLRSLLDRGGFDADSFGRAIAG
ncbi:MAG: zinc ribbon domain-containing protein [bacterium]